MVAKKITAVLLVLLLLLSPIVLPSRSIQAETVEEDPAVLMMAAAHARIAGVNDIDQLRSMKSGYQEYYDK
ncbi:MAG: hypothetical protein SCM11_06520, partial [Bacillota bacterium]|nr:hypothetical protein [Bacillota bacterium]